MDKNIRIPVPLARYSMDTARYAAYALSGRAFVALRKKGKAALEVSFSPMPGIKFDPAGLRKDFRRELEDEALRARVFDLNAPLREHLVLRAMAAEPARAVPPPEPGLTPEQEKELEELIASVEKEIKSEAGGKAAATWEERYGRKSGKKN
jgi:His-Xaa-Ser system protein HxsD